MYLFYESFCYKIIILIYPFISHSFFPLYLFVTFYLMKFNLVLFYQNVVKILQDSRTVLNNLYDFMSLLFRIFFSNHFFKYIVIFKALIFKICFSPQTKTTLMPSHLPLSHFFFNVQCAFYHNSKQPTLFVLTTL